jgi:hypothetical protein
MSYLMIENAGVAPIESFLLLGLSDARGDESRIGQFGSGAKHGVLTCLRAGLSVVAYAGATKIEFSTQLKNSAIGTYQMVCYKIDTKKIQSTNMTLGFGSIDWDDTAMALREFISNALDQSERWEDINVELVENRRAREGHTRVYVEASPEVKRYLSELNWRFLHTRRLEDIGVLPKAEPSDCRFYRKGVFVRTIENERSLFDYNSMTMQIDEARNADGHRVRGEACRLLTDDLERTKQAISAMAKGEMCYEAKFSSWCMDYSTVARAVHALFGIYCYVTSIPTVAHKVSVSHTVVLLPVSWAEAASQGGVNSAESLLTKAESTEGITPTDTQPRTLEACKRVWEYLELAGMTEGREFPAIRQYVSTMHMNSTMYGFYDSVTEEVWLHDEHATNYKTILEELVHYVSGANDESRDFQDYVLRFASRLIS